MSGNKFTALLFVGFVIWLSSCRIADAPTEIYDLKTEFQENPMGVDRPQPLFQWKMNDDRRGAGQTAYQLIVASSQNLVNDNKGDLWNTGKEISDKSVHIKYDGLPLESGKKYYWRVRVWDHTGMVSPWSDVATWEMGMLDESDWQAKWIARSKDDPDRSVYMRKEIEIPSKSINKARVYVTGLGNYVFKINGEKVGKDLLTPGWTHYPKRLEYQVYDVADYLNEGEKNALGAVLGNMWWSGGLGWEGDQKYSEGPLKFYMQLEMEFDDDSKMTVISDESWKWTNSPIWEDDIYDGEKYDANQEIPGWNKPDFDESDWQDVELADYEGKLVGPFAPAMRHHMDLEPVEVTEPIPGEFVFDLGQNMVGWASFKVNVPKGDTIILRFAELLHDDGTVAQENLRSADATDMIISNGEEFVWEPKFTYHGFRYVQASGLDEAPKRTDLTGKVIYTNQPFIGNLETSNDLINQINRNVRWGQRGNFYPAPTDCPQRDERLGWMGDAQIFAPTANFNMYLERYWSKWLYDITDGQEEEGWVYDVNPPIVVDGPSKPGWGDAVVIIPWLTYQYFGNTRIIEENYDAMKAWVEYMRGNSNNNIYIWEAGDSGWYGYGDWIAVEPSPSKPIGTAYYFYSTKLLGQMAEVIGNQDDASEYKSLADDIADAYQREYWDADSLKYPGGTQTANLLPLAFGITPEKLEAQVVQNLVDNVVKSGVHPTTGFLGTGYILPMLSKYNYHDLAYEMINQTTYPSWGYMVEQGATTIWELWNSDSEPPEGMNSRNHFALGCVGEWMWNTIAGINISKEKPGFKEVIIKPRPVEDLTWAKAEYETNYGKILVDWEAEDDLFTMNLFIPPNTSAVVDLSEIPGYIIKESGENINSADIEGVTEDESGRFRVSSGKYIFTVE